MNRHLLLTTTLALFLLTPCLHAEIPAQALQARNLGLAHLENEQPQKAEEVYRGLIEQLPGDPLGHANLAIALLRQQKNEEALQRIDAALKLAPGRADLLTIRGDVLQWSGEPQEALTFYRQAATAAPEDPQIQYALYRHATTLEGDTATAAAREALERLARLRPENVVVQLALGRQAIESGDRAAASRVYLRLDELMWQSPIGQKAMERVMAPLRDGDLAKARTPALRLENVLKVAPMFRESLRELNEGIQGVPVDRFVGEPPPTDFGSPVPVTFQGRYLDTAATLGRGLDRGDLDGDGQPDVVYLSDAGLTVRFSMQEGGAAADGNSWNVPIDGAQLDLGLSGVRVVDLDNDGHLDVLVYGLGQLRYWRGDGKGALVDATSEWIPSTARGGEVLEVFDFDIDGDLDLVLASEVSLARGTREVRPVRLLVNSLLPPLTPAPPETLPFLSSQQGSVLDLLVQDFDRDGDQDLAVAHAEGVAWFDNLRQGRFADRTAAAGLDAAGNRSIRTLAAGDLDNDGYPELIAAGERLEIWHNDREGVFTPARITGLATAERGRLTAVTVFDADNDGRLDLAVGAVQGVSIYTQKATAAAGGFTFEAKDLVGLPAAPVFRLRAADLDADGDLDLLAAGAGGLARLTNDGGNANQWLQVRLRGLDQGNSKNNLLGLGSIIEVRVGAAYQYREAGSDVTHFGLGRGRPAYLLRVVWTNGVPQQRLGTWQDQRIVEEQVLKGSCPFLYAWDGERFAFVTDLLWGAPIGLPVAPGRWASADPSELVRVDGARPDERGRYRLRVTEELWEAAFFDHLRLWVVDHPASVEVASNLRIRPGVSDGERVLAARDLRPVAQAWDGSGRDVTELVRERDEVYADGFEASAYQGIARRPWTFTFELASEGDAVPAGPVRLWLDGWIFPSDASLNLAVAQRDDRDWTPPRLEALTDAGWVELMPAFGPDSFGFPAGKTKTLVVDTPPLPAGTGQLRLVTTQWLSWDQVRWMPLTADPVDMVPRVQAQLLPEVADSRFRGFSRLVRQAPNAPHVYDYHAVSTESPWLPFPGRYSRHGDVRELLATADDRSVILGPGDEIDLVFDASNLASPPSGWTRTVFLESHGWDKDADRNTGEAQQVEPLPFRAMSGYPYGADEGFPSTPELDAYRRDWLTRVVEPVPGIAANDWDVVASELSATPGESEAREVADGQR